MTLEKDWFEKWKEKDNETKLKQKRQEEKTLRDENVRALHVEYNGIQFQGDEQSQDRMLRAIMAADEKKDIVIWLDADNNEVQLTIEELEIVFKAAWRAQQAVWFIPKDPPKEEKEK